jgi:hypothetical protein
MEWVLHNHSFHKKTMFSCLLYRQTHSDYCNADNIHWPSPEPSSTLSRSAGWSRLITMRHVRGLCRFQVILKKTSKYRRRPQANFLNIHNFKHKALDPWTSPDCCISEQNCKSVVWNTPLSHPTSNTPREALIVVPGIRMMEQVNETARATQWACAAASAHGILMLLVILK